jgi:hypothetical protein
VPEARQAAGARSRRSRTATDGPSLDAAARALVGRSPDRESPHAGIPATYHGHQLLEKARSGDASALANLFPLIYEEPVGWRGSSCCANRTGTR